MSQLNQYHANCLCQDVSLTVEITAHHAHVCHCTTCRRWGGGPSFSVYASNVSISNQDNVCVYASSQWAERGFCQRCGSHLFYRLKDNQQYIIPLGLFSDLDDIEITEQVFIDKKPGYYSLANETKCLTGDELFALMKQ